MLLMLNLSLDKVKISIQECEIRICFIHPSFNVAGEIEVFSTQDIGCYSQFLAIINQSNRFGILCSNDRL